MSPGQTGRTPGGVPPKFFMFIGFFLSQIENPTNNDCLKALLRGVSLSKVRSGGVPSAVEEVVRVQFWCSRSWKNNRGSIGPTVLAHRPNIAQDSTCG